MKKLIPFALLAVLSGVQLASVAQTAHVHEQQATQETGAVDMKAMHEEMHTKMTATKTDAERQQLMAEQQKKMQVMHSQMHGQKHAQMGSHDHGAMKGPGANTDMQKHMKSMHDQMYK